jgi:Chaperone of endosialidase
MTLAFTLSTFSPSGGTSTTFVGLAVTATSLTTATSYQVGGLGVGTAASGVTGEIRAAGNITGFYSSDAKFKENIQSIPNALDSVSGIGGKTFDWTDEYIQAHGGDDGYFVRKSDFGFIAQDVLKHFPLAVRTRPDGSLAVDYEKLCALAFAAIAELNQQVIELRTQLGNR